MSWLETSIMARKGLAKGKPGKTYSITEESQGQYHYVYGPYAKPVLKVDLTVPPECCAIHSTA